MTLGDLIEASAADVAALAVSDHARLANELAELEARTKRIKNVFDTALEMAYGGQNAPGTFHRKADGYDVKVTIPKNVKWDQDALENAPCGLIEHIDYKMSISENTYKALPDDLKAYATDARTEGMGKAKFEIKEV